MCDFANFRDFQFSAFWHHHYPNLTLLMHFLSYFNVFMLILIPIDSFLVVKSDVQIFVLGQHFGRFWRFFLQSSQTALNRSESISACFKTLEAIIFDPERHIWAKISNVRFRQFPLFSIFDFLTSSSRQFDAFNVFVIVF